jgi:hypothetical protein
VEPPGPRFALVTLVCEDGRPYKGHLESFYVGKRFNGNAAYTTATLSVPIERGVGIIRGLRVRKDNSLFLF